MKPLFILLTVLTSYLAQAANGGGEITPAALKSFEQTFSDANEVSWKISDDLYKVSFQVAGQYASAYYNEAGSLVVVTRNISPTQLPVVLLASIKQKYSKMWVSELFEVSKDDGINYYITLEDAGQKLILKSNGTSNWMRYQKMGK